MPKYAPCVSSSPCRAPTNEATPLTLQVSPGDIPPWLGQHRDHTCALYEERSFIWWFSARKKKPIKLGVSPISAKLYSSTSIHPCRCNQQEKLVPRWNHQVSLFASFCSAHSSPLPPELASKQDMHSWTWHLQTDSLSPNIWLLVFKRQPVWGGCRLKKN